VRSIPISARDGRGAGCRVGAAQGRLIPKGSRRLPGSVEDGARQGAWSCGGEFELAQGVEGSLADLAGDVSRATLVSRRSRVAR
jgi:hypothetical protein